MCMRPSMRNRAFVLQQTGDGLQFAAYRGGTAEYEHVSVFKWRMECAYPDGAKNVYVTIRRGSRIRLVTLSGNRGRRQHQID